MMAAKSDLPPAYTTLAGPPPTLNINVDEEPELKCEESKCDDGDDSELLVSASFEDKTARQMFMLKVLTVKLLQLLGFLTVAAIFYMSSFSYYYYMRYYRGIVNCIVSSLVLYLATLVLLVCCYKLRRQSPYKYMFLVAYPASLMFFISSVTYATHTLDEFCLASIYHCVGVFAVLVYCIFTLGTRFEFVTLYAVFIGAGVHLVLYVIILPFGLVNPFILLYITMMLTLEHAYILFALRVMTTKDYKRQMTPDDHIDAAIHLHIDYIYIIIKYLVPRIRTAFAKCANK